MKLLITAVISITLFATFLGFADEETETEPPKVGDAAPDFVLQDVEEKEHRLEKLRGTVIFLIMGNQKTRKKTQKWAEAFQKEYKEKTEITAYIVADLRSVPRFITKGFVRGRLKKDPPPVTALLDWKGEVHKRYRTKKEDSTLYLISQEGTIVFYEKADFKPEIYAELKKEIDKLLTMDANKNEGK